MQDGKATPEVHSLTIPMATHVEFKASKALLKRALYG